MSKHDLVLYHSPHTRGSGVLFLLEELGVPYEMKVLNRDKGENHQPEFLALNPLGKFPTLMHKGTVITEQVACFLYLADLFPEKGLAPALNDPQRGAYLRWMAYQGSTFEPAVVDRAMKREPGDPGIMPYASYEKMLDALYKQLEKGPYLLGERFYALDVFWGGTLKWCSQFGIIETNPVVDEYIERIVSRPAFVRTTEMDQALAEEQAAETAAV